MNELDEVELILLRRYQRAAKDNNEEEIDRLNTALELLREATDVVRGLVPMAVTAVTRA